MEECFKCHRSDEEVKLVNAVLTGEIVNVCEECQVREDIPVIRRPTADQIRESENNYLKKESVKERLKRMAGIKKEDEISKKTKEVIDKKEKKERESEIEKKMRLAKKRNKPLKLVDNFHWKIYMTRRKKRMTRKDLAREIGESETVIKLIENKDLPDDAERVLRKIGQYFNLKLVKNEKLSDKERIRMELKEKFSKNNQEEKDKPTKILKFDDKKMNNLTIADLQKMKEQKEKIKESQKSKEDHKEDMAKRKKADELIEMVKDDKDNNLIGDDVEIEEK